MSGHRFLARAAVLAGSMIAFACPATDAAAQDTTAAAPLVALADVVIRLPDDDRIMVRGMVDRDRAGLGAQSVLYPAPGLIGLAVAVIAHGVAVNATRNRMEDRLQAEADALAAPYVDSTIDVHARDLLTTRVSASGGTAWSVANGPVSSRWVVDYRPVFFISRDQRAVVVESHVAVHDTANTDRPVYEGVLRAVSAPAPQDEPLQYWIDEHGARLRDTTAALMAESLDIALAQSQAVANAAPAAPRTIRYQEGSVERFERGELIGGGCGRVLFRSLRGWIVVAPTRAPADPSCGQEGTNQVIASER